MNTDFVVTGWMFCVIPHIYKNASDHLESDHRKQVKNVIKFIFHGLYEYELHFTLDLFWTDHTDFENKNGSFVGDKFIWKIKDIRYDNINLWYQKYSLTCTKVLDFVA